MEAYQPALTYVSLVAAAIGVASNTAMLRVAVSERMKKLSISLFLAVVSVTDSVLLIFISMNQISHGIINNPRNVYLYGWHDWGCRVGVFLESICKIISSWLLVAMMAECYIRKCHPDKAQDVSTRERAFVVCLSVGFIAFAGCFPILVVANTDADRKGSCSSRYRTFYKIYVDVILTSITAYLVPVLMATVCLVLTSVRLCRKKLKVKTNRMPETEQKHDDRGPITKLGIALTCLFLVSCVPTLGGEILRHLVAFAPDVYQTDKYHLHMTVDILQFILLFTYAAKFFVGLFINKHWRRNVFTLCSFGQLGRPYKYKSGSYAEQVVENGVKQNGTLKHVSNGSVKQSSSSPIDETLF